MNETEKTHFEQWIEEIGAQRLDLVGLFCRDLVAGRARLGDPAMVVKVVAARREYRRDQTSPRARLPKRSPSSAKRADVAPSVKCLTCGHLGVVHRNVLAGANSGPCTVLACDCPAMKAPAAKATKKPGDLKYMPIATPTMSARARLRPCAGCGRSTDQLVVRSGNLVATWHRKCRDESLGRESRTVAGQAGMRTAIVQ
jgi:hypothetical protein